MRDDAQSSDQAVTAYGYALDHAISPYADRWAGEPCTLDGHPAKVNGRCLQCALVAELKGPLVVQITWPAVDRIMKAGGNF